MTPDAAIAQLTDIFRALFNLPDFELRDDLTAEDVAGWDSLNHITLLTQIEEEFGIMFSNEELESLETVGTLKALVLRKAT